VLGEVSSGFMYREHARETMCYSALQCIALRCSVHSDGCTLDTCINDMRVKQCVAVCCSVLQCVAVCCSVLQCVAVCCSVLQCAAVCCCVLQCVAVCCSVLHCGAVCDSIHNICRVAICCVVHNIRDTKCQ